MANSQKQSRSGLQRKGRNQQQHSARHAALNEAKENPFTEIPEKVQDALEPAPEQEVEATDVNDDEIVTDLTDKLDFRQQVENNDIFEYNPNEQKIINQRTNMLLIKKTGSRLKVYLSGYIKEDLMIKRRQYEKTQSEKQYHRIQKLLFIKTIQKYLQQYFDGFYPFELEAIHLTAVKKIVFSSLLAKEMIQKPFTVDTNEEILANNIRRWLKNLSLQFENGALVSFNMLTPEGKPSPGRILYTTFRRRLGQNQQAKGHFKDLMLQYSDLETERIFKRKNKVISLLEDIGFTETQIVKLSKISQIKELKTRLNNL